MTATVSGEGMTRRARRAAFLAERAEARALRDRLAPRRARQARTRAMLRQLTYRF